MRKRILAAALLFTFVFSLAFTAGSRNVYAQKFVNKETDYNIVIEDDAGLLSETEEENLIDDMKPISNYGHVVFKSIDSNPTTTKSFANDYYYTNFKNESGTVLLIDMDNRNLWIVSSGAVYKTLTTAKANTITDNIYRYASKGDYYTCAKTAFSQMLSLLEGSSIAEPMKHVSNAILAVIIAMLIFFIIVNNASRAKRAGTTALLEGTLKKEVKGTAPQTVFVNETRRYSPVQRSSGGGGGFSGGGGGGGGFSGGGGGHGF